MAQRDDLTELASAFTARGWGAGLVERAVDLRFPRDILHRWTLEPWPTAEFIERRLDWHERLTRGDLRGREATRGDNEAFSELWANSTEELGDWDVTTERGPNAFAQFQLQENATVLVLELQGQLIATCAFASRLLNVGGVRLPVRYGQALRVHNDHRRKGYGDQVRSLGWAIGSALPTATQYDYMRSQNYAVVGWWEKYSPGFFADVPKREGDVPGQSVTVLQYEPQPFSGDASNIRKADERDLPRCAALINRTHGGHDLFRTYSVEMLAARLNVGYFDNHLERWFPSGLDRPVYSLDDLYVLEEGGRIVACAGLWDRGRDVRDRWRHRTTGETRVVETTAVLDIGFSRGHEASLATLLRFLIGESAKLGRTFLTVPLDPFPKVANLLSDLDPIPEVRALRWGLTDPPVRKPHTDLVYW